MGESYEMELLRRVWAAMGSRTVAYLISLACGAVLALAAYLCLLPFRRRRLKGKELYSSSAREAALALFWMFCGGMAVLTVCPRWVVWSVIDVLHGYRWNVSGYPFFEMGNVNLVPFKTFAPDIHSLYILAGNVLMFVPFGFFAALLWRGWNWRRALGAGFAITLFVEGCQLFVGRTFDIDDLLLNTLGVLCGCGLRLLFHRLFPRAAARFQVIPLKEEHL